MKNDALEFDPYDYYKKELKGKVSERAKELIENLTKKANIDTENNKKLNSEIKKLENEIDNCSFKCTGHKVLNIFLIILGIAGVIFSILGIVRMVLGDSDLFAILSLVIGIIVAVGCFLIVFLVLRKKIKKYEDKLKKLKNKHQNKVNEAWQGLAPLRESFDFSQYIDFVNDLNTTIKLDKDVDKRKLKLLNESYDLNWYYGNNESVVDVYSGTVGENPFLRILVNRTDLYNHTYTGTRVVTWTKRVRGSDGKMHTVTESETLVASYSAPAPKYFNYSMIIYGNGAAPKLTFSRNPSGLPLEHDEKDVEKLIKKRTKEIEERAEEAIKKGKNFTALANNDFDALFYAIDRNNETEFRLLFTPLAQQNMTELICATDTYGDDFRFLKQNKLNYIVSNHSSSSIDLRYTNYFNLYNYEELKNNYINDITREFYSLYFDLAPILAIPLYQMNEAPLYDGKINEDEITYYEAEASINHMNSNLFRPIESKTNQILKTKKIKEFNDAELYKVTSYSYDKIPRTTYVPVACRNGGVYDVAVNWFEYIPCQKDSNVAFSKIKNNDNSNLNSNISNNSNINNNVVRYHNFASFFVGEDGFNENDANTFANEIKKYYNNK